MGRRGVAFGEMVVMVVNGGLRWDGMGFEDFWILGMVRCFKCGERWEKVYWCQRCQILINAICVFCTGERGLWMDLITWFEVE